MHPLGEGITGLIATMKQLVAEKSGQEVILTEEERANIKHYEQNAQKYLMNKRTGMTPMI